MAKKVLIPTNAQVFKQLLALQNAIVKCSTMCLSMLGEEAFAPEARNLYAAIQRDLERFDGTSIMATCTAMLHKADKARKHRRSHAQKE